jgi:hypothetical protein
MEEKQDPASRDRETRKRGWEDSKKILTEP